MGLAGALGAVGFRALSGRLTHLLFDAEDIVAGAESLPPILRIFLPAAGGFLGIGKKVSAPEQKVLEELAAVFPD